ncbi:MAG TPA: hypothetical protein VN256_14155 [Pyrinomonadaceae bacterium]|nr:hypothetical protein [Pyrinomonadaceae bacterium]
MALRRVILHAPVWLCVFGLWLFATSRFHPTWTIAVCATAILVSASALAVYLEALVLRPRLARRRLWPQYALSLLGAVAVLDLAAVLSIGAVYDWLWRPDPLRFGFWFNVLSDGFVIVLHLGVAALVTRSWRGERKAAAG